jgi:hypothetical protein
MNYFRVGNLKNILLDSQKSTLNHGTWDFLGSFFQPQSMGNGNDHNI